jgi:hypothetical protein
MKMIEKYELKQILQDNVMSVVFTKVDGSERTMNCTLIPEYVPQKPVVERQQLLTESLPRAESPDTLAVWDVDANGWRSFRLDSIKAARTHETRNG